MHQQANWLRYVLGLRRANFRRSNIFPILFAALLVNCGTLAIHFNHTNAQETRAKKRILPLRATESADGTQVAIVSDTPLTDYTTSRSGDRYYVIIPQADTVAVSNLRGRGLDGVQAQKRGDDLILTFRLQPGATARVSSRFNRLDVAISTPFAQQTRAAANSDSAVTNAAPINANTNAKNSNAPARANDSARLVNAQSAAQASPSPRKANIATRNNDDNRTESDQSTAAPSINSAQANNASNSPSPTEAMKPNAAENATSNHAEVAESNANANLKAASAPLASTAASPVAVSPSMPNSSAYGESFGAFLQRNWQWLLALLFIAAVGIAYFFLRLLANSRAEVRVRPVSSHSGGLIVAPAAQSQAQNISSQTRADFASSSNAAKAPYVAGTPEDFDPSTSSFNAMLSAPENSAARREHATPLQSFDAAADTALASSPPQSACNDADLDLLADEANGEWRIPIIAVPQFNVSREAVLHFERRVAERRQGERRKGERRRGDRRQSGDHENASAPRTDAARESSAHDVTDRNEKRAMADFHVEKLNAQPPSPFSPETSAFAFSTRAEFDDTLLTAIRVASNAPKHQAVDTASARSVPLKDAASPENPQAVDLIGNVEHVAASKVDMAKSETPAISAADDILELEPTAFAFAEPTSFNVVKRERPARNERKLSAKDQFASQLAPNAESSKALALHDDSAPEAQSLPAAKSLELKNEGAATEHSSQIEPLSEAVPSSQMSGAQSAARIAYISQLALEGTDEAFREICSAFDDPSPEVRMAAARAINRFHGDRTDAFTRALREASPERRRKIGRAIAECGLADEAIDLLNNAGRETTYDAFSLLFLMAKAGELESLVRAVETHPDKEVRMAVIKLLALSGQPDALPPLRRLAVKGSLPADVRSAVMEAIYQLGASQSAAAGTTRSK